MNRKLGWFGWTLISTILIVVIGSTLLFFNLFGINMKTPFTGELSETPTKQEKKSDDETLKKVEEIQETVGKEYIDIGTFVSDMHDFYIRTTGYGKIDSLDWDEQVEKATYINETIKKYVPDVKNEALKNDLTHIQNLANKVITNKKTEEVRYLHRMFHDLDIALNNYDGYDKIWHVTETLKSIKNE